MLDSENIIGYNIATMKLEVLHAAQSGRIHTLIVRGKADEVKSRLAALVLVL